MEIFGSIMILAFLGFCLWLLIRSHKTPPIEKIVEEDIIYYYRIKKSSKGKYRLNIYDSNENSILISSGRGKNTKEEVQAIVDMLEQVDAFIEVV